MVSELQTDLFSEVLGFRRGAGRHGPQSATLRLLSSELRYERELVELLARLADGHQRSLTDVAVELIAQRPALLLSVYPRRSPAPAERFVHEYFEAHCREERQLSGPATSPLLSVCGYPCLSERDHFRDGISLPLVGGDWPNFRHAHREAVMAELHGRLTDIGDAGERERVCAELLELHGPRAMAWLAPALAWHARGALMELLVQAAVENPVTTLRRAVQTRGFYRLAKRKGLGSVKSLHAAADQLSAATWRQAFTGVLAAGPTETLDSRRRALEVCIGAALTVSPS